MYALGGSVCGEVAPRQSARAAYSSSVFGLGQIGPGLDWQSGPWSDTPESELIWTVCLSRGRSHAPSPPGRSWRKFRLGVARRRVARFCEAASLAPDDARACEWATANTRGGPPRSRLLELHAAAPRSAADMADVAASQSVEVSTCQV